MSMCKRMWIRWKVSDMDEEAGLLLPPSFLGFSGSFLFVLSAASKSLNF